MINEKAEMMGALITKPSDSSLSVPSQEPLIKIRASQPSVVSQLRAAWDHRELLYFLIWRDLKVRYKQTALGAAWVILQPLLMTLVFTVFISKLARVPSDGVPYALFAYAGLLPWMFFSGAVLASSQSLLSSSYIITKVYFPRLIVPVAVVGVRLVDFLIASVVLVGPMLYYGVGFGRSILMLPLFVIEITFLSLAIGLLFSVLSIKYRDVGTVLPVLIQLWMFASPIIYPSSLVPERWRELYALNPIVGIVEGVRASLFRFPFNTRSIIISAAVTLIFLIYSYYFFCRTEGDLLDVL